MNQKTSNVQSGAAVACSAWLARNFLVIWIILCAVDIMAYAASKPLPEKHWNYYLPAVGGWMALHDKLNAR